jgi:hypothetical protein
MSYIIYPQADNKLAVIYPAGDVNNCIKDVPTGVEYAVVDDLGNLDNDYFNAFEYADLGIACNIDKAKAIHLDKFRAARAPKLTALDIAYSRADEAGDTGKKAEIGVQKQALRDVTKVELPNDLAALKNFWPSILA